MGRVWQGAAAYGLLKCYSVALVIAKKEAKEPESRVNWMAMQSCDSNLPRDFINSSAQKTGALISAGRTGEAVQIASTRSSQRFQTPFNLQRLSFLA